MHRSDSALARPATKRSRASSWPPAWRLLSSGDCGAYDLVSAASVLSKTAGRFSLYFLPSVFSAGLSFLMLPLVTRVVGPAEYGVFALVSAYTAFGSALATLGGNYIISHRFPDATVAERS